MTSRSCLYDVFLVLLGVLVLVIKGRIGNPLLQSYGGNVAAAFSTFFLLKPPLIRCRFQAVTAAGLALLATELFEASDGFGFMSNTYDTADYLANAIGVALAACVDRAARATLSSSHVQR